MSKKSTIFQQIQDFIRNASPKVLKANHATVEESLLNSVNSTPVYDSLLIQQEITAIANPDILTGSLALKLWFKRVGNEVIVTGDLKNNTTGYVNTSRIASIKPTSEFFPDDRNDPTTSAPIIFRLYAESPSGEKVRLAVLVVSGVAYISNLSTIPLSSQTFYINGRYDAKD